MKNKLSLLVLLVLLADMALAQNDTKMSLNDCIDYAMKNQTRLKSAKLDEEITTQKNNEIIGIARPQIKASGQFQYLFLLPKQRASSDAFDFSSSLSFFKIDTPAYMAYMSQPKKKYSELQNSSFMNLLTLELKETLLQSLMEFADSWSIREQFRKTIELFVMKLQIHLL